MNLKPVTIKFLRLALCLLLVNSCSVFCKKEIPKKCPPPEFIHPCICSEGKEIEVICDNILSYHQLVEVFEESSDYTFWKFVIQNSTFTYLPSTSIVDKKVRKLIILNSVMTSLFDRPPSSSNKLIALSLGDCVLRRGFEWELFSKLVHLQHFAVVTFNIKKIDQSFVDHFPVGVKSIYFIQTKLNRLHDYAFSKLTELQAIFMNYNEITTLKRSMFAPESKLGTFDFSFTKISNLPEDIFKNMPMLKIIVLESTNIVVLQESVFKRILPQIEHLSMPGDKLNCNCQMKWLTSVKIPPYTWAACEKPPSLKGVSIKDLKAIQFAYCE